MNCIALTIKQARKFKMQGGYSKYDLCVNIYYRNSGQFTTHKAVT